MATANVLRAVASLLTALADASVQHGVCSHCRCRSVSPARHRADGAASSPLDTVIDGASPLLTPLFAAMASEASSPRPNTTALCPASEAPVPSTPPPPSPLWRTAKSPTTRSCYTQTWRRSPRPPRPLPTGATHVLPAATAEMTGTTPELTATTAALTAKFTAITAALPATTAEFMPPPADFPTPPAELKTSATMAESTLPLAVPTAPFVSLDSTELKTTATTAEFILPSASSAESVLPPSPPLPAALTAPAPSLESGTQASGQSGQGPAEVGGAADQGTGKQPIIFELMSTEAVMSTSTEVEQESTAQEEAPDSCSLQVPAKDAGGTARARKKKKKGSERIMCEHTPSLPLPQPFLPSSPTVPVSDVLCHKAVADLEYSGTVTASSDIPQPLLWQYVKQHCEPASLRESQRYEDLGYWYTIYNLTLTKKPGVRRHPNADPIQIDLGEKGDIFIFLP
eukprot:TRINITY_DN720_c1_g1_i2.p1 TRINITY_DN720_c1_g1~~TRINITY_DN720_c1_g1_i2.p1  ORF type:complete len:457 (-),score=47.43 TRINITY_DN720_c1_g1_i2:77-1447(-)